MSQLRRRLDRAPATSGLSSWTDIFSVLRQVSKGPQGYVTATAAAFVELRDRVEVVDPRLLRANK